MTSFRLVRGRADNPSNDTGRRWNGHRFALTFFPLMSSTTTEPNKVIYSMMGVTKSYDRKVVLKDIWLSYFYGAKIGVLGLNGAGKSSLLRILAGQEKDYQGQISLAPATPPASFPRSPGSTRARRCARRSRRG